MENSNTDLHDREDRRLRAAIFGDVTDTAWSACAHIWTRPDNLHWLRQHQTAPFCPPGLHWKAWNNHPDAPASLK